MPRNMALVRRSTNRGERPAADSNHRNSANSSNESRKNDASQVVTEEDEDLMPSKLYMIRAEQDTDWQPSNSAVLKILFSLRLSAALWSTISDCDEVFNYWEPLHLLLFGEGLQTWEYSPVYAIRSYFYVYLHYMPARLLYNILPSSKIGVFLSMRCLISMLTLAGEFALYQAVCKRFCIGVGRFFVLFSLISTGMFISSSAFLPSSFAMAMNMLAMAAYLRERWFWAIFCTALSGLVGWPFAAILGLPIVIDMLFIRGRHHFYYFFYFSLISAIVIVGSLLVVDSYYYGKRAPLNIVLYNVFSPHGPDLYGVAPASFYVKNLLLNCNLLVLLAPAAFPLSICCYIHYFPPTGVPRKFRIPVGSYWNGYAPVFLLYLTLAFWCLIFFSQAHKEERFLFPVYPLITLMAAIALDALQRLIERFRDESVSNWLWVVVLIFCCVSLSRTYSLYRNFNGTMETYKSLNEHLMAQDSNSKLDFSVRNDPLRLCVGKEWHRFPSSFFLPHSAVDKHGRKRRVHLHFLKSEFRGLLPKYYPTMRLPRATQEIPTEMNDQNKEEPSRYVDLDSCDYVIDLEIPEEKRTELEPSYGEMTETFRRVASHPFLLSEYSHFFYRAFYVPYFTPKHTMTDEVQNNGDNSQEKEEEQLGNKSAESSKNAGAISKSVALSREVNRAARALVMESNKLITEDVLTLTKTYPACNALIEQQEIRIHNLMKKLMRKAGTGVQPPKLETAEVAQLIERTITATDNLCGDIHMIIDALDKAQRDEIVKIPKQVVGAESTRKHLTAEDKAAAIRRIATNLPSLLAQRMRQRDADMNTRKVAMHIEKPQKKYGFSFCIDNSEEPFKPKLVTKHHAKAPLASNLTVIDMDEGKGKRGKRTWQSDMAQSLHPYAFELEHLKIPEQQLNSKKPIKSINLENQEIVLVDSKAKLDELIGILNKEREFAVDLEHHCDRSFLGLCCLVQISTRTTDFIVDPFPIWKDMHALNEPFTDPNILKVFHGSSSDVDWLQRDFGIYVVNMFDTYWAAKKLEFKKFSLAHIVSKIVGETLDKQYQLADWRVRPLPKHLISYARQDTHYLLYCYDVLREELLKKGIEALQFVYENSKSCCARVYEKPKFDSEKYLSLSKRQLNNQQMHALTGLSQWRNQAARSEDEGPEFVMPTYQMLHIAESLPRAEQEILACCYPLPPLVKQFSNEIYKIVWSARVLPQEKKSLTSASSDENRSNLLEKYVDEMNRMTAAKALLRCNIDFSHTNFDEEIGGLPEELLNDAGVKQDVLKKLQRDSYLPVLLGLSGSEKEITVVGRNKYKRKLVNSIVKELEEWVSPYECYQILEKREAKRRKEEEEKNQEK